MNKTLTKTLSAFLTLVMLCAMLMATPFTASADTLGNYEYTVDESGGFAVITKYIGSEQNITVPQEIDGYPVLYIGSYAFMQNTSLKSLTIPSSVKAIGDYAFYMCTSLSSVSFSNGIKYIGISAFDNCISLMSIALPDTLLYLDDYAFYGCTVLSSISLGKRLAYIGEQAIGTYQVTYQNNYDGETGWNLYSVNSSNVNALKSISGYENTAAPTYIENKGLSRSYTSLGMADLNDVGDLNGDGEINIKDATTVQKIVSAMIDSAPYDIFVADTDDDNRITGMDATQIQKEIVGLDVTLGTTEYGVPYTGADPAEYDIPTLTFTDITDEPIKEGCLSTLQEVINYNSKNYTTVQKITLTGTESGDFDCYADVKLQGSSSMGYAKKNYTIKLYEDALEESKNKTTVVESWGKENKYVLKANYIDHSHARNVVSAKLWGEVVRSRANINENLTDLVNGGAIDGFPIKVYRNGKYEGLYTFNIPKDGWLLGMDSKGEEGEEQEAVLCGEYHSGASAFQNYYNTSDFSLEYATDEDNVEWIGTTFNRFYEFVRSSSDADFKQNLSQYTDVEACIDYILFVYTTCAMDCWDKNMLLVTFDSGEHWIPSAYDLDTTFGLHWNGQGFYTPDTMTGINTSRNKNVLLQRIERVFSAELEARYAELRQSVFSLENIADEFLTFTDEIPASLYALDLTAYSGIPSSGGSNVNQIITYAANRLEVLDAQYNYNVK